MVGVGSQPSAGLNKGIIVDIDKTAQAIQQAVTQAEEKSNVKIKDVVVGLPANYLKVESCTGMVTVADQNQSREIVDQDVVDVAKAALIQNIPPEREVIDLLANEFIVDGFDQIKDPRGMVGFDSNYTLHYSRDLRRWCTTPKGNSKGGASSSGHGCSAACDW